MPRIELKYTQHNSLYLRGTVLNKVESTKFLGVHIDGNLSWTKHVDILCTKISKNVGVMNRLKFFLSKTTLLTLYNSLILPYLNYAILAWGNSTSQCNKLLLLQKRAVRILSRTSYRSHTNPLFAELNILKMDDLFNLHFGKFMFK